MGEDEQTSNRTPSISKIDFDANLFPADYERTKT